MNSKKSDDEYAQPEDMVFSAGRTSGSTEAEAGKPDRAIEALTQIAAFDDEGGSRFLMDHGNYSRFDEPGAVKIAREALWVIKEEAQDATAEAKLREAIIEAIKGGWPCSNGCDLRHNWRFRSDDNDDIESGSEVDRRTKFVNAVISRLREKGIVRE